MFQNGLENRRTWQRLRTPLATYANLHPSDEVRALGHEVEAAVSLALSDTILLLSHRNTDLGQSAFEASQRSHDESLEKAERLIALIRDY
jgi:hypothetical protein